jgi:aryl-alcohol dehydrogenase-like predicted oxidoreductase
MIYRTNTRLGQPISVIGFGCWSTASYNWSDANTVESVRSIQTAIDCGINFFDVAPIYGFGDSETLLGQAIKGHRDEIFIATKCGLRWDEKDGPARNDLSAASIQWEVEQSLKRLEIETIDLYQMHWPDHGTQLDETMAALQKLIEQGKIRHIGASNFSLADTAYADSLAPVSAYQGLYNLFDRNSSHYCGLPLEYKTEDEILPYCEKTRTAFIPYSPLCQGVLSGRYYRGRDKDLNASDMRLTNPEITGDPLDHKLDIVEQLKTLAEASGHTLLELALGWMTAKESVTSIIVGSRTADYARTSAAVGDIRLSQDVLAEIEKLF